MEEKIYVEFFFEENWKKEDCIFKALIFGDFQNAADSAVNGHSKLSHTLKVFESDSAELLQVSLE